jgi:short-subunit dehydrogenase
MARAISEQVVVITGASSGIGRETALMFGRKGASVVVAARNEEALHEVAQEIGNEGGKAHVVATDVAEWSQVERLAKEAIKKFGKIDTWVNDAGVAEYATVEQMTIEEIDRIIKVNLMGEIYGMKAALPHLKKQDEGTIINVSSVLGVRSVPLQAAYCAAKHGVNAFGEALRMELEHEGSKVAVTTIMPSSINTPFFDHARSKMGVNPQPIPPVYEPSAVAEAIVFAAEHPQRQIYVGAAGKMISVMQHISPRFVDRYMTMNGQMFKSQQSDMPDDRKDNMFTPSTGSGSSTGQFGGRLTQSTSLYTRLLGMHPNRGRAAIAASGLLGAVALKRRASHQNGAIPNGLATES